MTKGCFQVRKACIDCRKSKLKCDDVRPCKNCTRKTKCCEDEDACGKSSPLSASSAYKDNPAHDCPRTIAESNSISASNLKPVIADTSEGSFQKLQFLNSGNCDSGAGLDKARHVLPSVDFICEHIVRGPGPTLSGWMDQRKLPPLREVFGNC